MAIPELGVGKRYSIAEARDRLAALVHEAECGRPAELTRRGRPVAVILSLDAYRRLAQSEQADFWSAYERFRESVDPADLVDEPDPFADVRDRSPGREPGW